MSAEIRTTNNLDTSRRSTLVAGLALIALGALVWVAQSGRFDLEMLFLPALGAIFLAWGLIGRNTGLLIPGGLLAGIGLGLYLTESAFTGLTGEATGGIILLSMAGGWVLVSLLSFFTGGFQFWPLIPGGIMAAIGGTLLAGEPGLQVLEMIGRAWPLGLIAVGLYLIGWKSRR